MRKIISLLLAIAMVMSMTAVAFAAEATFTDLEEGQYYVPAVEWAVSEGVTTGMTETTFAPHATCTRAQVVTFLYRAAGEPEIDEGTKNPFTDVAETAYYYNAVLWAVAEGITTGMTETTFGPDGECLREHVVTFMWRAAGESAASAAAEFTDVAEDAYYADAVAWAVEEGITTGMTETTFNPTGACERAHVVTFLYRSYLPAAVNNPILVMELTSIEVAAGAKAYYNIHGRLSGQILTIVADEDEDVTVIVGGETVEGVDGVYSAELTGAPVTTVVVINNGEKDADLVVEINYASGTEGNPIVINLTTDLTSVAAPAEGETYYQISSDLNGMLLNIAEVEGLTVTLNDEELVAVAGVYTAELTGVPANKLVVANATQKDIETPAGIEYPAGSESNPVVINLASTLTSVAAPAEGETYYQISSDLNGMLLNIAEAEGLTVTLNDEELVAVAGVYTAELTGVPVNKLVVANTTKEDIETPAGIEYPAGSESNPVVINLASALTSVAAPADGEAYYQISSTLNGMLLNIVEAEGLTVTLNDEELVAVDGIYTAELTGVPVNKLVVTNTADEDIETPAAIEYPAGSESNPIVINAADDMGAISVAANEQVYYAISSRLFGQGLMLNIEALENLVVTVNGEEAVANEDGYYVIELDGEGVVMAVVASNVGEEDLEAIAYIQSAPGTEGNPIMIIPETMTFPGGTVDAFSFNLPANGTVYYYGRLSGKIMTIDGAYGMTVTVGEDVYNANMLGKIVIEFPAYEGIGMVPPTYLSITNADEENECFGMMTFTEPEVEVELKWGFAEANVAAVEANGTCEYRWTAETAGTLEVVIDTNLSQDWWFMVDTEVNGYPVGNGENHFSDVEPVVSAESIAVEAGDTVLIVIGTASFNAGEVSFYLNFTEAAN